MTLLLLSLVRWQCGPEQGCPQGCTVTQKGAQPPMVCPFTPCFVAWREFEAVQCRALLPLGWLCWIFVCSVCGCVCECLISSHSVCVLAQCQGDEQY